MRRGFTILELLVASLLLGMLMTILTMIFNQSSIAWRTGVAGVANMNQARKTISDTRNMADNAYPSVTGSESKLQQVGSVLKANGEVSSRNEYITDIAGSATKSYEPIVDCRGGEGKDQSTYVVNVMSAGPDGKMDTYDDIWSFPDDPEEWCK